MVVAVQAAACALDKKYSGTTIRNAGATGNPVIMIVAVGRWAVARRGIRLGARVLIATIARPANIARAHGSRSIYCAMAMGATVKVVTYAVLAVLATTSFVALAACFPRFVEHARAGATGVMAIKGSARVLFTVGAAVAWRAGARCAGMVDKRARAYSAVKAVANSLIAVRAEVTRVAVAFGREVGRHDAAAVRPAIQSLARVCGRGGRTKLRGRR